MTRLSISLNDEVVTYEINEILYPDLASYIVREVLSTYCQFDN